MSYCMSEKDLKNHISFKNDTIYYHFPKDKGVFKIDKKVISNDVILFKNSSVLNEDMDIVYEKCLGDFIFINIPLDGSAYFKSKYTKEIVDFNVSHIIISNFKDINGLTRFRKNRSLKSLEIMVNKNANDSLFEDISNIKSNFHVLKNHKATQKTLNLAKEIYTFKSNNTLDNILLQSKVLELVFSELSSIKNRDKPYKAKFSNYDKQALEKAGFILSQSFINPPSIKELSRLVSLNEFKLKYGFKYFYGNTIYQTVLNHKLENAKQLLKSKEMNVNETARAVGYKYTQNFTAAFTRHYGINPKEFLKS